MTAVDGLWYLADEAARRAERRYHRLADRHEGFVEFTRRRSLSRERFRTVADRTREDGLPYGAHTLPYRPGGELLLVRHEGVDMWVVPGGGVEDGESPRAAARRELREEAGVAGEFEGLGLLGRVEFRGAGHSAWGVLPLYAVRTDGEPDGTDPDGEISDARWFDADRLPEDTRDRDVLVDWLDRL